MSSRVRGGAVLARQTSQAEKDVTLLRLSAVGGCHLPTDCVCSHTAKHAALGMPRSHNSKLSGAVVFGHSEQSTALVRWFGSRGWQECHVLL